MDLGIILGIVAVVAAFAVPLGIEAFKRPRLEITPSSWSSVGPVNWTFATVRVRNRPVWWGVRKLLTRQAAQACEVDLEFYRWGTEEKLLPTIPGRWSSHQQPIRSVPSSGSASYQPYGSPVRPNDGGTASTYSNQPSGIVTVGPPASGAPAPDPPSTFAGFFDASLDPRQQNVAVSPDGEEVAVAILTTARGAFAFSTDSYDHSDYGNPNWTLKTGSSYRIVVHVHGSSVSRKEAFRLDYNSRNFSDFTLKPA
jgi:hypothetical protein